MSSLKFDLVLIDRFLPMHVAMSLDIAGVHPSLSSSWSMASNRVRSKDTDRSTTRVVVKWVSTSFPIYEDTKLIIDKDIKMKWHEVNDAFSSTFGEDLEDCQVYVNIHKSILYWIACKYRTFPCADMICWIVSHTDPKTMKLSSVSGMEMLPLGHMIISRCTICQS